MQLLVRLALRIMALALKFVLTIVVARSLGFAAVADYGLALAVSVVSSKLLGLGFSTEINRRLSLVKPAEAIRDVRRLLTLYFVVYCVIAGVAATVYCNFEFGHARPVIVWGVLLVAFSEHAGLETTSYVFSLHRPRAGALLLFVRTGAWAGVAIFGLLVHTIRSIEMVFTLWWVTNVITAIAACWFIWRRQCEVDLEQSDETWRYRWTVRSTWLDGAPFFAATTVLSGLQYAERFIANWVVSADALGRYVFSWSIANSIQTVAYATIVVTAGPRLVRSLSSVDGDFWRILNSSVRSSACISIAAATAILILYKSVFRIAHEPAGTGEFVTLLTLLASFVMRSVADIYWCAAIALRFGKRVAMAIAAVATFSIPLEWLLVWRLGVMGAAFAHLAASIGIVVLLGVLVMQARIVTTPRINNGSSLHVS